MATAAGYGFMNNRGNNFNTYKAMERHMDGNGFRDTVGGRHQQYGGGGESFLGLSNDTEQDLFEKVRSQMSQMGYRKNWGVKPATNGKSNNQGNGEQTGKYNNFYGGGAQGGAQRPRFGGLIGRHKE
nr:hypothetical protein Iba_chr10bCG5750 [Ipomoea batatas]